jgi:hypothetical protein
MSTEKPEEKKELSNREKLLLAQQTQLLKKMKEGKSLTPKEWEFLREEQEQELYWPDRRECAKELCEVLNEIITVRRLYEFKRQGAPIKNRGRISKIDLLKWFVGERRGRGGRLEAVGDSRSLREQKLAKEIEMISARLSALQGSMLDATYVENVLRTVCEDVRNNFRNDFPAKVFAACVGTSAEEGVEQIRFHVDEVLTAFARSIENVEEKKDTLDQ